MPTKPTTFNAFTQQAIPAYRVPGTNPYTNNLNDPFMEAQHNFAGPGPAALTAAMRRQGMTFGSLGRSVGPSLAGGGGDEAARSGMLNAYLGSLADENAVRPENAPLDAVEAELRALRGSQDAKRAMAIANDPRSSQGGAPIVQAPDGSYATVPREPAGPVNRQALAAQMAPGQIAPPSPDKPVAYGNPVKATVMVDGKPKETWVRPGSDGLTYDMGRKQIPAESIQQTDTSPGQNSDVADVVAGMMTGTLPPQLPGRASKEYIALQAEAKRQGYDLAQAATDWTATQKHVNTMNGAQQLRLNQAVNALPEMLDSVDSLAQQWKGGKFPILNKANLALAKGGAYGQQAATIANQLDAQIADVVADLGNVYMGGNSPTDHALSLAGKSLSAEWDEKVLRDMVSLAKKNVAIRQNSIRNTGVAGASANNPYGSQGPAAHGAPPPAASATGKEGERRPLPGGGGVAEFRGGKWIRVE